MDFIWKTLLKGLVAVLPVALTLYLIYWLAYAAEKSLRPLIELVLPPHYYWPGLGLIAAVGLIFVMGILVNAWLVQKMLAYGESLLDRIPLVKSIFGALRDFMQFFSRDREKTSLNNAVAVTIGEMQIIGFQVQENVDNLMNTSADSDIVVVYLPLSYQIGGYTICVPRSRVQPINMSNEDTMRWILTAGLSTTEGEKTSIIVDR